MNRPVDAAYAFLDCIELFIVDSGREANGVLVYDCEIRYGSANRHFIGRLAFNTADIPKWEFLSACGGCLMMEYAVTAFYSDYTAMTFERAVALLAEIVCAEYTYIHGKRFNETLDGIREREKEAWKNRHDD